MLSGLRLFVFLFWGGCLLLSPESAMGSNRVTTRPVFPTMDYTLTEMGDSATRIVFHTTYHAGDGNSGIPFLGYTIDSSEKWMRVVAWYDIRDAKTAQSVARHDTVYFQHAHLDSVRLVAATIYRDSLEYPFSRNDWNIADSLYFFSPNTNSEAAPQAARLRVRTTAKKGELRLENPDHLPLTGLELLSNKGALIRKINSKATTFSTAGLQEGIYFLRFRSRYGNRVEIVIVNKAT